MSSRNAAALESHKNDNNRLQTGDVCVYKGGSIYKITLVRIDESVSTIDDEAFCKLTNLRTVSFSTEGHSLLKKIGNYSFYECGNLLSIDLRNTQIESIGNDAFYGRNKLASIQFPATIQRIEKACFYDCTQLKVVDLSHVNHLESIEEYAFYNCTALQTVNLPPTTSCIGDRSFYGCEALGTVDLRATGVNEIGRGAFDCCKNLSNIYFPTTTKFIGGESFNSCTKLACLDLHATCIETVEAEAFADCDNLKTINFPKTLKYIGEGSFYCCHKLKHLNLHETSIEGIGDGAFQKCTNLTRIVGISTSYQEELQENMGDDIFYSGCMILPISLLEIGEDAFDKRPKWKNSINTNWIHYQFDVSRSGRQFLGQQTSW